MRTHHSKMGLKVPQLNGNRFTEQIESLAANFLTKVDT